MLNEVAGHSDNAGDSVADRLAKNAASPGITHPFNLSHKNLWLSWYLFFFKNKTLRGSLQTIPALQYTPSKKDVALARLRVNNTYASDVKQHDPAFLIWFNAHLLPLFAHWATYAGPWVFTSESTTYILLIGFSIFKIIVAILRFLFKETEASSASSSSSVKESRI